MILSDGTELNNVEMYMIEIIKMIFTDNDWMSELNFTIYELNTVINDLKKARPRFNMCAENENIILYFFEKTDRIILTDVPEEYIQTDLEGFDVRQHVLKTIAELYQN
jgi:hypothetical protein